MDGAEEEEEVVVEEGSSGSPDIPDVDLKERRGSNGQSRTCSSELRSENRIMTTI